MMKLLKKIRAKLVWKGLAVYLCVVLLPSLLIGMNYFFQTENYILDREKDLLQKTLDQYCIDIDTALEDAEYVYNQLQQHTDFMRFLTGEYHSPASQVSLYTAELQALFNYGFLSSGYIKDIIVYMADESLLEMGTHLRMLDQLRDPGLSRYDLSLGRWIYDIENQQVIYYRTLKSLNAKSDLGILEIKCTDHLIRDSLDRLPDDNRNITLLYNEQPFYLNNHSSGFIDSRIKVSAEPSRLPLLVEVHTDVSGLSNSMVQSLLRGILCLILLSFILFFMLYHLSRRITRFSHSLASNLHNYPRSYSDKGHDELSQLINNYNNMIMRNNYLLSQIQIEKLRQQEIEYKALQSQINPHFIYNTLEGIRMMAELKNESDISAAIFSLSQLMRYAFSISEKEVTIDQELENIRQYIILQQMRLGNRVALHISSGGTGNITCPRFTLQPMVENAVNYGFSKEHPEVMIHIDARLINNTIDIRIVNTGNKIPDIKLHNMNRLLGAGASLKEYSAGNGISLENVNNRMRYLHPDTFSMNLENTDAGVLVHLSWNPDDRAEHTGEDKHEYTDRR